MNSSKDFLAGIEMIKSLANDKGWSDERTAKQIQSFAEDWKDRRHSDLIKRHNTKHGGDLDAI